VEIAEVAEVVAAVGVLISLLYVGYEVNQNTAAVKSTAYQAIHDAEDGFWSDLASDETAARLWENGLNGGLEKLGHDERPRYVLATRRLIYLFQNVHYQSRKGVVDAELWGAWVASLDEFLVKPGFREVLDIIRPHLSDPFNQLVDSRITRLSQK
ncbi:MAG: hypothetical protein OES99_11315, partial [Gammaproteobacteria bacterium]|nr:hypothetical protein [Gammaproteobacteria bacterium]